MGRPTRNDGPDDGATPVHGNPATTAGQLHGTARALEGTAQHMRTGGRADQQLMVQAGFLIVRAFCEGLLESLLPLPDICPDAAPLIEHHRSRCGSSPPGPSPVGDPEQWSDPDLARAERRERTPDLSDEDALRWRWAVSNMRIEEMLRQIARDGDPSESVAVERERWACAVVAAAWWHLSERFPAALSPVVARIKHELLPGADPWLGLDRDFLKAAWVCEMIASEIDNRCDYRIKDAAAEWKIPEGTISRACGKKKIVTNGKRGQQLRMNRQSAETWRNEYLAGAKKRNAQRNALGRGRRPCRCGTCNERFPLWLPQCPHCGNRGNIIEDKRSFAERATTRKKSPR